jgi:hypothetical protein
MAAGSDGACGGLLPRLGSDKLLTNLDEVAREGLGRPPFGASKESARPATSFPARPTQRFAGLTRGNSSMIMLMTGF